MLNIDRQRAEQMHKRPPPPGTAIVTQYNTRKNCRVLESRARKFEKKCPGYAFEVRQRGGIVELVFAGDVAGGR